MRNFKSLMSVAVLAIALAFAGSARAQSGILGGTPQAGTSNLQNSFAADATGHLVPPTNDPCDNQAFAKSSVAVAVASATTTELVAAVAGQVVYVCSFNASFAGTSPTGIFKTGTKVSTACDTGPANLTGTYAPTAGQVVGLGFGGSLFQSATSGEVCLTSGGTPSIQGVLTYVQKAPAVAAAPIN